MIDEDRTGRGERTHRGTTTPRRPARAGAVRRRAADVDQLPSRNRRRRRNACASRRRRPNPKPSPRRRRNRSPSEGRRPQQPPAVAQPAAEERMVRFRTHREQRSRRFSSDSVLSADVPGIIAHSPPDLDASRACEPASGPDGSGFGAFIRADHRTARPRARPSRASAKRRSIASSSPHLDALSITWEAGTATVISGTAPVAPRICGKQRSGRPSAA